MVRGLCMVCMVGRRLFLGSVVSGLTASGSVVSGLGLDDGVGDRVFEYVLSESVEEYLFGGGSELVVWFWGVSDVVSMMSHLQVRAIRSASEWFSVSGRVERVDGGRYPYAAVFPSLGSGCISEFDSDDECVVEVWFEDDGEKYRRTVSEVQQGEFR